MILSRAVCVLLPPPPPPPQAAHAIATDNAATIALDLIALFIFASLEIRTKFTSEVSNLFEYVCQTDNLWEFLLLLLTEAPLMC